VIGVNRVFPQLLPPGLLNEEGMRLAEAVKDGCLGNTTDGSPGPKGHLSDYTTVADVYSTPGALSVLPQLALPQPGEAPVADVYFYHQVLDQLAPVAEMQKVADAWCAAGTSVHVFRDLSGEHVAGAVTAVPSQYLYLLSRFAGTATPVLPPGTQSCNQGAS
ncbi:MAG: lipase family protein, partial [Solimonas sp.]